jgi:hypothetical protein
MNHSNDGELDPMTPDGLAELEARVLCRLCGVVRHFRLFANGRGLILRGRSTTYYAKQLAQHTVMQVTRLPILANEIEVS